MSNEKQKDEWIPGTPPPGTGPVQAVTAPLDDAAIHQIARGLEIPSQAARDAMAAELAQSGVDIAMAKEIEVRRGIVLT